MDRLGSLFSSDFFMPHGHCYLWQPELLWVQAISNGLIGGAYFAIAATLAYLVYRGKYVPFKGMALGFGVFIVTCGVTHFMDVYVIWRPEYWVDGGIRLVTAVASVGTAVLLPPLVPKAIALSRGARAMRDRGIELETALDALGNLYERTKELDLLKTQFFANVSHELRTPLTLILGPAERLVESPNLSAEERREIGLILQNGRTLLKHVNDLLDVSKLEAGKVTAEFSRYDLAESLRVVASHFEGIARERRIAFRVEAPSSFPIEADREKTERVLLNLLSNAFKFTPIGGAIRCSLESAGDAVRIEVADSGPGIPVAHRQAVFERFRQLEGAENRPFGGTGLGLAIARDFVTLQGGTIEVDDAPEGGALFRIRLARRAPRGAALGRRVEAVSADARLAVSETLGQLESAPRKEDTPTKPDGSRPTVLVVEDNPAMNVFVRRALDADFHTLSAADGRAALEVMEETVPDLVVTDFMMPGMSGDEFVRTLRGDARFEEVPVMMLTAKADESAKLDLLRGPVQDYMMKPFSERELRVRAQNLVRIHQARTALRGALDSRESDIAVLAEHLAARQKELRRTVEEVQIAREQAERAHRAKSEFLGLVSHELLTPIQAIRLQLDLLNARKEKGVLRTGATMLAKIDAASIRLQSIIQGMLEWVRVQSGELPLAPEPVELLAFAREAVDDFRGAAERKGLTIEVDPASTLGRLETDPKFLRAVIRHLVDNAVRFTTEGRVTLRIDSDDGEHRLRVIDTGPGIPTALQSRIFDPFEQGEQVSHKHVPGVGLGLSLVRELVRSLGGTVRVRSEVGVGSEFQVTLPARGADALGGGTEV